MISLDDTVSKMVAISRNTVCTESLIVFYEVYVFLLSIAQWILSLWVLKDFDWKEYLAVSVQIFQDLFKL